jgi:hypothetical protein
MTPTEAPVDNKKSVSTARKVGTTITPIVLSLVLGVGANLLIDKVVDRVKKKIEPNEDDE